MIQRRNTPVTQFVKDPEALMNTLNYTIHASKRPAARVMALIEHAARILPASLQETVAHARALAARLTSVPSYGLDLDREVEPQRSCSVSSELMKKLNATGLFMTVSDYREWVNTTTPILRRCGLNFIEEALKERLRLIIWPRQLNAEHDRGYPSPIGDSVASAKQVRPNTYARAVDIREAFHHMKLEGDVPLLYVATINEEDYVFLAACMGVNWSGDLCHLLCKLLACMAINDTKGIDYFVHVDNVRFVGPQERKGEIDAINTEFVRLCGEYNLTLREEDAKSFCGIEGDHETGVVRLTKEGIRKLNTAVDVVLSRVPTYREVLVAWGRLAAAARIVKLRQYPYFTLWKFIRRKAASFARGDLDLFSSCPVWPCTIALWKLFLHDVLQASREGISHGPEPLSDSRWALYVDASTEGWGAVLFDGENNQIYEDGGKWYASYNSGDMGPLEAKAIGRGLSAFKNRFIRAKPGTLLVLSDSTSAKGAMLRSYSASYNLNQAVAETFAKLSPQLHRWTISIAHVSTDKNIADLASRGERFLSNSKVAQKAKQTLLDEHHTSSVSSALTRMVGQRLVESPATLWVPQYGIRAVSCSTAG